ncbi:MAG: D-2-hydroxyacid dehydrogenase family protein [Acidisphaera sp.]|nr:D-2-hydroxyacid dehydrogenase family protein [Acidisphaera sp.]
MTGVAVLDDWQGIARQSGDWSALQAKADVVFFPRAFAGVEEAAAALAGFEVLIAMRERTAFSSDLLRRLPRLRLIALTGGRAMTLDLPTATERGVLVSHTGGELSGPATAEIALGLLLAVARRIPAGDQALRAGRFQEGVEAGTALAGKTLGLIGLGRIGGRMARFAHALDMKVLAWSPHLTQERAEAAGAGLADKDTLLASADAVSLHIVLSDRTRGLLGAAELSRMKPGAILINTSRGPLVDEVALLAALQQNRIRAGLDVYDQEPLPKDHPLRSAPNTVLTPHLGYGTQEVFRQFYAESIENVLAWFAGAPIRMLNPDAYSARA